MMRTSYISIRWWWWWCAIYAGPSMLSWIFIVLVHWDNSPRVDMSYHSETLSRFRATESLLLLSNVVCSTERQNKSRFQSLVWLDRGLTRLNPLSTTLKASRLTITLSMRMDHVTYPIMEMCMYYIGIEKNQQNMKTYRSSDCEWKEVHLRSSLTFIYLIWLYIV